ncbi:MAG: UvrD-helicase domain-containing protein [Rickettsiaceae bacterium]
MKNLHSYASNPNYSVWVDASAGTGKTKILIDRVLRLLMHKVEFHKILCITFTNTAASEVRSRINDALHKWSVMPDNDLKSDLIDLLCSDIAIQDIQYAKQLYFNLLNSKEQINICTIHAFCRKILQHFPLESGIAPNFKILDDITRFTILANIKRSIYLNPLYADVVNFFISNFHETTVNDLLYSIISYQLKFKQLFNAKNNIDCNTKNTKIIDYHREDLIIQYQKIINQYHYVIYDAIGEYAVNNCNIANITRVFLTKDGSPKKRLISKQYAQKYPELFEDLCKLQIKIYQFDQLIKAKKIIKYSNYLIELARILLKNYDEYKAKECFLDYDDLIHITKELLSANEAKDWVLYKLDGGIDHLLIDEAQDISHNQWQIIAALISEFYSGDSNSKNNRTIFVVGDEKQSIFSFQGAEIESFLIMYNFFQEKLSSAHKKFKIINLEYSYRSTKSILSSVHFVFDYIKKTQPQLFQSNNPNILPFRTEKNLGEIEIWPLIYDNQKEELFWPNAGNLDNTKHSHKQLALCIANRINEMIENQYILPSTGQAAKPEDFMILIRKRSSLSDEIIYQLQQHDLPSTGKDLMVFNQNLSILDLISIAKFTLNTSDDLNLASLLKSPIIRLSEQELYDLTQVKSNTGVSTLFEALAKCFENPIYNKAYKMLDNFLKLYQQTDVSNFFHIIVDSMNYREILIQSNEPDSNDAINELLYLSRQYASNIDCSLQNFIYWFDENNIEIKRNVETESQIRIMTVHSSKGLQAPVVIMCDTTTLPTAHDKFIWARDDQVISTMNIDGYPEFVKQIKGDKYQKTLQEYLRLLYVGMTRAQDHLIVCGCSSKQKLPEYCWYDFIHTALQKLNAMDEVRITFKENLQTKQSQVKFNQLKTKFTKDLTSAIKNINYTDNTILYKEANSPISAQYGHEYGKVFHKLLEDAFNNKNFDNILSHHALKLLPSSLKRKIKHNITQLLQNKEFTNLLHHNLQTELNIGIKQEYRIKTGRIDLLIIEDHRITIIDYKSDANPPDSIEDVPPKYLEQVNFYRNVIQDLYPNHKILIKILWLENARFMSL